MIEHIRSYEVSIWTLQDSFITVLKPSNLEPKGQIQNPSMKLKDSNDDTFSFRIPMYLNTMDGSFIENPIWFTTRNGNIIADMRKIKVIFNKGENKNEKVFEFLITNVKEKHEGFSKYCEIECEGLPICSGNTPYRCHDNLCVKDKNSCSKNVACGQRLALCSDFICRSSCDNI